MAMNIRTKDELEKMTLKDLLSYCDSIHKDASGCETKGDIIRLLTGDSQASTPLSQSPSRFLFINILIHLSCSPKPAILKGNSFIGSPEQMKKSAINPFRTYRFHFLNAVPVRSASEKTFTV